MRNSLRQFVSLAASVSLILPSVAKATAAQPATRAAYEACQAGDDTQFRDALVSVTTEALRAGVKPLDYGALVAEQWRRADLDQVIDRQVDASIAEVKTETSWSELISSLTDTATAQKLATTVAERVYRSEPVKTAMEQLASGVAGTVGTSIELAGVDAADSMLGCLKTFVGPRYGSAIATAVAGDAGKDINLDPNKGAGEPGAGAVLRQSSGGLAGATLLIVRRQLANLATRVGQRVVGAVLSRLVSVVAGGVGLVLIAKDLWELRNGVLPIIAGEMKSPATKDKVREEMASTIATQINDHISTIGAAAAEHMIGIWRTFKTAHALVLRIAEADVGFRSFVDGLSPAQLPRLDEVVSIITAEDGESSVLQRLANGSLATAVITLPDAALSVARETRSLSKALAWHALAGDKLDAALSYDLHRSVSPDTLTAASLRQLLALEDRTAITRLAAMPAATRSVLFNLSTADLKTLARNLPVDELASLAGYLDGLRDAPRDAVLRAVADNPARMQLLADSGVRNAILSSRNQQLAVAVALREPAAFAPRAFASDVREAWSGNISPWLLWQKHPLGLILGVFLVLAAALWLMRLFRRPQITVG